MRKENNAKQSEKKGNEKMIKWKQSGEKLNG